MVYHSIHSDDYLLFLIWLVSNRTKKTRTHPNANFGVLQFNDEVCLYFGSTYIKSLVPNREVSFPPSLWNQRDAAVSGIARTTNAVEGWHFGIQSYFSGTHPNMWKVVGSLQKDASVQKLKLFDASSGHKFTKKKKYRVLNERVQNIMSVYEDKTDL